MTLSCSHMVLYTLVHLSWIICWLDSNGSNQSTQHRLLSECEKCTDSFELFVWHCHVFLYHCASIIAAFLNTEWLEYNISYLGGSKSAWTWNNERVYAWPSVSCDSYECAAFRWGNRVQNAQLSSGPAGPAGARLHQDILGHQGMTNLIPTYP